MPKLTVIWGRGYKLNLENVNTPLERLNHTDSGYFVLLNAWM